MKLSVSHDTLKDDLIYANGTVAGRPFKLLFIAKNTWTDQ